MMSSGSGMDMSSMVGGAGGAYDVTAYVTMPEGASGAKAGKAIEELCADLPCQVTASGSMDSMSTYLAGSGVSLRSTAMTWRTSSPPPRRWRRP